MQALKSSGRPWESAERRAAVDRRIGERRSRRMDVSSDRRRGPDRRSPLSRRETAEGHVRNAIQIIKGLAEEEEGLSPATRQMVDDLLRRLYLALTETQLLASSRAELGHQLRQAPPGPGR